MTGGKRRRKGSGGLANESASSKIVDAVETVVHCESKHRPGYC